MAPPAHPPFAIIISCDHLSRSTSLLSFTRFLPFSKGINSALSWCRALALGTSYSHLFFCRLCFCPVCLVWVSFFFPCPFLLCFFVHIGDVLLASYFICLDLLHQAKGWINDVATWKVEEAWPSHCFFERVKLVILSHRMWRMSAEVGLCVYKPKEHFCIHIGL